jgi:hypothetical protein
MTKKQMKRIKDIKKELKEIRQEMKEGRSIDGEMMIEEDFLLDIESLEAELQELQELQ